MLLSAPIQHRNFEIAAKLSKVHAVHNSQDSVIFVTGPSGAGKSTLRRHLLTSLYGPPESWPENQVLITSARATNADSGFFSSKDFYLRLLHGLGDPFRGRGVDAAITRSVDSDTREFLAEPMWSSLRVSMTETRIRRAFEQLARALRLKAILVDEAQSMCLTHLNRDPSNHLESLKCLAEELGIMIYMFGTYDLLKIWNHSSQLNRRSDLIHLPRYDDSIEGDRDAFFSVLRMLGLAIPLEDFAVLSHHAEEILRWTYGVIGEVAGLFKRACVAAFAEGSEFVKWDHIKGAAYTPAQLKTLRDEIAEGEALILGELKGQAISTNTGAKKFSGPRPGRRKPGRDGCGARA